jgi:hypothetical protein
MECPLGYKCGLMGGIEETEENSKGENEYACEQFSLSWNLPWEYDEDGALIVTNDPTRFWWKKDLNAKSDFELENPYCPIKKMEAGFYYRATSIDEEEKIDYRQIIRAEWKKAGWEMASPIRETETQIKRRKLLAELRRLIEML